MVRGSLFLDESCPSNFSVVKGFLSSQLSQFSDEFQTMHSTVWFRYLSAWGVKNFETFVQLNQFFHKTDSNVTDILDNSTSQLVWHPRIHDKNIFEEDINDDDTTVKFPVVTLRETRRNFFSLCFRQTADFPFHQSHVRPIPMKVLDSVAS